MTDWLSLFCFTYFTDRDGKYQLKSFAESAFDPLSRTCRFMLTEEAHHMFVGETGISRVVKRTLEVMKELGTDDPARIRAPARSTCRRCRSTSTSGARARSISSARRSRPTRRPTSRSGMKGRPDETTYEDHVLREATMKLETPRGRAETCRC